VKEGTRNVPLVSTSLGKRPAQYRRARSDCGCLRRFELSATRTHTGISGGPSERENPHFSGINEWARSGDSVFSEPQA